MPIKRASQKAKSDSVFGQARKPAKMFRAGLYARVSTDDQQTIPLQIHALREYIGRRGWTIAVQVREVGSGAAKRQAREKLLEAARRREIDVVLVWRLDRWGRSVTDLLATLQELEHLGVGFVSLTEALDLTTPAGRAMAGLLVIFAEFEREILRERTRAGLAQAGLNGKRLGRPETAGLQAAEIRKLYRAGASKSEIARRLEIGYGASWRIESPVAGHETCLGIGVEALMSPEAEPNVNPLIWAAIAQKRLLRFYYKNRERIVEPHDYGIHNGLIKLFGYQVGGSSSQKLPNWRWAEQDLISDVQLLDRTFPGGRLTKSGKHHKWEKLFIRVKPADNDQK
jgi:putative DNA-invertase from lambdoid prophage Rac